MARTITLPSEADCPGEFQVFSGVGAAYRSRAVPRGALTLEDDEKMFASLSGPALPPDAFATLAGEPALESIYLTGTRLTGDSARQLARLPGLRRVHCSRVVATPDAFAALAQCPALDDLWCSDCEIEDAHVAALAERAPALASLVLSSSTAQNRVTDAALEHIARLPALNTLRIYVCEGLTGATLGALCAPGRLVHLQLSWLHAFREEHVAHLRALSRLEHVDLSFDPLLGDATCAVLAQIPTLTSVELRGNARMTAAGLEALGALPRLERVALGTTRTQRKISGAAVAAFTRAHPRARVSRI